MAGTAALCQGHDATDGWGAASDCSPGFARVVYGGEDPRTITLQPLPYTDVMSPAYDIFLVFTYSFMFSEADTIHTHLLTHKYISLCAYLDVQMFLPIVYKSKRDLFRILHTRKCIYL